MRRYPLVLIATGALFLSVAGTAALGTPARAANEPGSEFSSLDLAAVGGGVRVLLTHDGTAEADVPYAQATMKTGPRARALSSITWPGAVAANLGNTLVLVGNPVPGGPPYPEEVEDALVQVDYPVRAEAGSGSGPSSVKNDSIPGTVMTAQATQEKAAAEARFGGAEAAPVGKFGATRSLGTTELTGAASAVSQARSVVKDITLAGGEVAIGSVSSVARATTDGEESSATGRTHVTDMEIAGVPATVDQDGVHVAEEGASGDEARDAVDAALEETGFQLMLTESTGTTAGGSATSNAGSLIIAFPEDGPLLALGGARAHATGTKGDPFSFEADTGTVALPPGTPTGEGGPPATSGTSESSLSSSSGPALSGDPPGDEDTAEAQLPTVARQDGPQTSQAGRIAPGVSPAWFVLAVLGALLIMAGATRLPHRLVQATVAPCANGDQ